MLERLTEALKDLREPFRKAITANAVMHAKDDLRGLSQIIMGPPCSGKTTEARRYAEAIRTVKLVGGKNVIYADGCAPHGPEQWIGLFKSAENGVIVIDEIYSQQGRAADVMKDLLIQALDMSKCAVVLTGNRDPMEKFLNECRPELRARMPATPVTTDRTFTAGERAAYQRRIDEERRARLETERRARELERSKKEWLEMSEDVTLKRPMSPMKGMALLRKNDTVS